MEDKITSGLLNMVGWEWCPVPGCMGIKNMDSASCSNIHCDMGEEELLKEFNNG